MTATGTGSRAGRAPRTPGALRSLYRLMLETQVTAVTPNEVYLSGDRHVPTRTIISAIGTKPPPIFDTRLAHPDRPDAAGDRSYAAARPRRPVE